MKNRYGHYPFFVFFVLLLLMNHFVYLYGDDFRYAAYFGLYSQFQGQEFSFQNVLNTQLYDYFHANGRLLINIFTIFTLVNGIELWRLVNPLLLTLLAYSMFYTIYIRLPKRDDVYRSMIIVTLFMSIHILIMRQTINYATGAFNYIYPMIFLFLFIAYFRRSDIGQPVQSNIAYIFFIMAGFLAGWSQEQVSALSVVLVTLWLFKQWFQRKRVELRPISIALAVILGAICLFLAPGPKLRVLDHSLAFYNHLSMLGKIKHTLPYVMNYFVLQQTVFIVLVTFFLALLFYQKTKNMVAFIVIQILLVPALFSIELFGRFSIYQVFTNQLLTTIYGLLVMIMICLLAFYLGIKEKKCLYFAFTIGFLMPDLIMIFTAPVAGGRVAFPAIPFAICLISFLISQIKELRYIRVFMITLGICAFLHYGVTLKNYYHNAVVQEKRINIIQTSREPLNGVMKLPALKDRYYAAYEITNYPWVVDAFKAYYQIPMDTKIELLK
ncbi:hypothetical protein SAMN05444392_1228 [Seinonella peptonophila]|uniref:Glucosyl transferase GtrII n=1 Tax=Seinonella peptonophila TaxID=112248 RepID=A0A1M5BEH8_9BACL|nr:DUF6056 family protein [Seinonella peptonophila]SHF40911.1 hypothetical protein SAMN05444392_1228 [Seinonella peptonophila]